MTAPVTETLHHVRLLAVPVQIWARSQESGDELLREFTLIAMDDSPGERDVPQRLTAIAAELRARYGHVGGAQTEHLEEAAARGETVIDELTYDVPAELGAVTHEIAELLDEVDTYCRSGDHLLSLASTPDVRAFRWWFLQEFERQLEGHPPTSWPSSGWAQSLQATETGETRS